MFFYMLTCVPGANFKSFHFIATTGAQPLWYAIDLSMTLITPSLGQLGYSDNIRWCSKVQTSIVLLKLRGAVFFPNWETGVLDLTF